MITTDTVFIDRYQIEELLSQKSGRRTFLAKELQSQVPVIIKLLQFGDGFEWDDLKLFEREANTLKNLDHSDIPKYLDYFEVDEAEYSGFALVQSYIEAPSLATLMARGRKFSEDEIIELADRLLDLLIYLHQQHPPVIHRDIKPSNILLGNRSGHSVGDVYLVDFGSVQTVATKEEGTITIVGSYGYMPPEQFGGRTVAVSDLYGLGMTLIYLLTGTHPAELPQVDGRVRFSAEVSKRFERWLEKMTHPHLDRRFDSAEAAQLALRSEDGSYGSFEGLKPANTQIRLCRDRNRLKITWSQSGGDHEGFGCLLPFVVVVVILISVSAIQSVPFVSAIQLVLFLVIHLVWATVVSAFIISCIKEVKCLARKPHHLVIDDEHICHWKEHGGNRITELSKHLRSQLNTLAYNPGYTFDKYLDTKGKLVEGSSITVQPKLYLYCGDFEYSFPSNPSTTKFSHAELWWLGQELSDFLNLELQVIYPTPKVPPVPSSCGGGC